MGIYLDNSEYFSHNSGEVQELCRIFKTKNSLGLGSNSLLYFEDTCTSMLSLKFN